jgi:O-acetylhomoserine (thiol)-lyase
MFNNILPQFGITAKLVDINNPDEWKKQITDKTKLVFTETIGNPILEVADMEPIARAAKEAGLPLVVDSTFTPPCVFRPVEWGANVVVHSLTKWIGGHGTSIGGIVVDAGNFTWDSPRFPLYTEADDSYHGIRWGRDLGDLQAPAFSLRIRTVPLRNLGAAISPDNAWNFLQGIETLSLRFERQCSNALAVAQFLDKHPKVSWVTYPGLPSHPTHQRAKKYFTDKFGGMVIFGIKGGKEGGITFADSLEIFTQLANVGDAKSLVIHPASTTHSQLSEEQQSEAGISPDLVRLSIGIENIDDLIEDLTQALDKA